MEVQKCPNRGNKFLTRYYNINDIKSAHIKELAREERLQFTKTLTVAEQESCENVKGLFIAFSDIFKPQYNEPHIVTNVL